ncbi:DsbA family oxidoreductase [Kitasatospora sp. NPDC001175]|uniref:DsbA family oxidoreductase n=1 Tax=Kitasatospora sp. NPDC001175 TaxID=3157103 RepID=UPI003D094A88
MKIEIWSDIMCPWRYIGKRRLETALARFEHRDQVEVVWRSFELRPDQPRTPGPTLGEMMQHRLGLQPGSAVGLFAEIERLAQEEGLHIELTGVQPVNSFDAQRLVHLAADHGLASQMKERLFRGYLGEQRNVADPDVLLELALDVGLDPVAVKATLDGDAYAADVRGDEELGARRGVTGVPGFFINGGQVSSGVPSTQALLQHLIQAR